MTETGVQRVERSADVEKRPALVYLAGLAKSGRRSMRVMLATAGRWIADALGVNLGSLTGMILSGEKADRAIIEAVPWHKLTYAHVVAIRTKAEELGKSPATINLTLSALRGTVRAAWRLGLLSAEELARIEDVGNVKSSTEPAGRRIERGVLAAIMASIDLDRPNGKRDAAVIAFAYAGGLRRREIAAVQFDQVKDSEDGIEIMVKRGKGRKDRRVYLDNGGAEALRDYIEARGKEQGPLFYASRKDGRLLEGEPVGEHSIYAIVKRAAERAGVEKMSTHDLRRSFVSDMLEAGADISVVAGLAGHASVQTTARYDRRGDDAKRKAARLLHVPYRQRRK